MRLKKGFTLIELLVVIAIIAILAAILFPVFSQARDKARQTACLSNMKQIGTAVMLYTQDHDEYLPFNYAYTWPGQAELFWWQDLCRPYMKNEQVYSCPSAAPHMTYNYLRPAGTPNPLIKDYIANSQGGFGSGSLVINGIEYGSAAGSGVRGPFTNNWMNPSVSLAEIEDPAGTIAIFETGRPYFETWVGTQVDAYYNATQQCTDAANVTSDPRDSTTRCQHGFVVKRHNAGFVAAFVDGHAKWIKNSRLGEWTRRAGD